MSFLKKISLYKRTIGTILMVVILAPLFYFPFPKKTEAQWPVFDVPTEVNTTIQSINSIISTTKDIGLDSLAWIAAEMVIKKITAQTVNWINSGFKGSPAFITDPNRFFMDVGDQTASRVLSTTNLNKLCSPFQAQVRIAIVKNYLQESDRIGTCTLGKIEQNFDNFTNNFSSGGWDAFFSVTQNSQNNPYGAYMNTKNQLNEQISIAGEKYNRQLDWGNGFLSYEACKPGTEQKPVAGVSGNGTLNKGASTECKVWDYSKVNTDPTKGPITQPVCKQYYPASEQVVDTGLAVGDCSPADKETVTPGSVINGQMEKVFGSSIDKLNAADEINEIFSALLGQLTDALIGGIGKGLRGLTQKTSANQRTFYDEISPNSAESNSEYNSATSTVGAGVDDLVNKIDQGVTTIQNNQPQTATGVDTPFLSLNGDSPMNISVGTPFDDPGVTALDPETNQTLSVTTTGSVDVNNVGTYTINYSASNSKGSATVSRIVNVQ